MGAFGEVYLARDPDLARDVAVKVVSREQIGPEALELLLREARAVAALQHPSLVTVYDVGSDDEQVWVVMEYVPGETLRHRLERGPLSLAEVVRLGGSMCGALAVAHSQGVIHRDIKPANILLTPQGDAKLADFGMARTPGDRTITDSGALVGTLMYMSPQQAMGEIIDGRSDLFSLAVVLYEALTGTHPFLRGAEAATLYAILHEPPSPPKEQGLALDERLRTFFRRALGKDASDRHPDALAFAEDLSFLLEPDEGGASAAVRPLEDGTRARFESRLVGRDAEFERLRSRLERVRTGEGGTLLLEGEAGIGKTRLLAEITRAAELQHFRVVRGRALYEGGPAYHPWRQLLTEAIDASALGRAEGLEVFLQAHPDFAGARAASLRRLLHLDSGETPDLSGPDQIWEAAVAALQALARERPLLAVLDDLHWADLSSLQLFRFAAAHARGQKWLLIGAFRSEEAEADGAPASVGEVSRLMGREEGVEHLQLARLDRGATAAMVDNLLEERVTGTALEERIFTETEGNPLFILEVAKLVAATGGKLEDLAIPARVVDVVEHRLDRLTTQERDALEVAAVEGEYFHVGPVATVLELTRIKTLKLLQGLERRHRIVRPAEQRFRFDHGKIREVIVGRIADPLRREYHGIVASCLQAERNGTSNAVLAHHFAEAGDPVGAFPYRRQAAAEARAVFANEEALHHLGQALATLDAHPEIEDATRQRAEILLDMGKTHQLTGNYVTADEHYERVAGTSAPVPALAARARLGQGECAFALSRYDQAMERLDEAMRVAVGAQDRGLQSRIHVAAARVHTRRAEFNEALHRCEQSEALARDLGDERHHALSVMESGDVFLRRGALDEARAAFDAALAIAGRSDDVGGQARALNSLASVARQAGDFPAALEFLGRSGALCRHMGEPLGEARALANQGNVYLHRGQWDEARRCYEPALRSFRALGARHAEAVVLSNMSVASSSSGDYPTALEIAHRCLSLQRELGDRWAIPGTLDNLGILEHRRGRSAEARRLLREAVRMRRELGERGGLVDSLLSLAVVEKSLAAPAAAVECAR
ncbi:MAG TPA: tetratricopeptide repeat protein, partial [Candidatus Eisenbacteria bacterium]|nr:tetratricopeptide repeat protein [Candidatus Eisenbacteria bacterium]